MNLTGQGVYRKGSKPKKGNQPTDKQLERWKRVRRLGCLICQLPPELHHAGTGQGGWKDHDKVIPLCAYHHRGAGGLHSLGRKRFAELHGTEEEMLAKVAWLLGE